MCTRYMLALDLGTGDFNYIEKKAKPVNKISDLGISFCGIWQE